MMAVLRFTVRPELVRRSLIPPAADYARFPGFRRSRPAVRDAQMLDPRQATTGRPHSVAEDPAQPRHLFFRAQGVPGPAIVFLHGLGCSGRYWQLRTTELASRWRLLYPDLLGFGQSPWPVIEYGVDVHVAAIRQCIEDAGLAGQPITLVGHSLGAALSLEYAARFPQNIERLMLFSLPYFPTANAARATIYRERGMPHLTLVHPRIAETLLTIGATQFGRSLLRPIIPPLPADVIEDAAAMTWNAFSSTLEHCIIDNDLTRAFTETERIPTCIIHGTDDRSVPYANVESLTRRFPDLEFIGKVGSGHHLMLADPEWCLGLIKAHAELSC